MRTTTNELLLWKWGQKLSEGFFIDHWSDDKHLCKTNHKRIPTLRWISMPARENESVYRPRVSAGELNRLLDQALQAHASYTEWSINRILQETRSAINNEWNESRAETNDDDVSNPVPTVGTRIVTKVKEKKVDNVSLNRLTIIFGPTGSGKSTPPPPLLQKGIGGCIICT